MSGARRFAGSLVADDGAGTGEPLKSDHMPMLKSGGEILRFHPAAGLHYFKRKKKLDFTVWETTFERLNMANWLGGRWCMQLRAPIRDVDNVDVVVWDNLNRIDTNHDDHLNNKKKRAVRSNGTICICMHKIRVGLIRAARRLVS